ncbi:unnamed protein product, partial [Symbiodinium necroappetens]
PDALRPRFQAMELQMRSLPGWQPLEEPQAVLPTALDMPEDAALAARRIDALVVGVFTIGLAVVAATVPVAVVSLLACMGEVAQAEEEEFEMQLGPLKTAVFAVRASSWTCRMAAHQAVPFQVLTSWSKADNLMLGGAGLAWEIIWLWLIARGPVPTTSQRDVLSLSEFQAVLATDVVGYFFRAVQAAWMKRQISVTDPVISIVMSAPASVFPVLGPRVDLLKDCLFAGAVFQLAACQADGSWRRTVGFWVGIAALLTIFLPAPALHGPYLDVPVRNDQERDKCTLPHLPEASRRDLAAEFWPALVARLRVKKDRALCSSSA